VGTALAHNGFVEVLTYPFVGPEDLRQLRIPDSDPRRAMPRLANPLSDEAPWMRSALLFTLLPAARRNIGRGHSAVQIFELGSVFLGVVPDNAIPPMGVEQRPTAAQWSALEAALPHQPLHCAGVLAGEIESSSWWGSGRVSDWSDAVEAAREIAEACGVEVHAGTGSDPMFHPGRCAELFIHDANGAPIVIGNAGELHPTVSEDFGLPARSCAFEVDLDQIIAVAPPVRPAPVFSTHPVAKEDLALVVDADVPAGEVEQALRGGAGELLESIRLFDVYTGPQVGEGKKSLAFALRLRAPDRTLSAEETAAVRQAAIAAAETTCGAILR
jgi:phenylalanyl-tRNA synthetase beta chain